MKEIDLEIGGMHCVMCANAVDGRSKSCRRGGCFGELCVRIGGCDV